MAVAGVSWRIVIDGKTLRGAAKRGAQAAHLLEAVSHGLRFVLGQVPVDDKTNKRVTAVIPVLNLLVLQGRLVTVDTLSTQKEVAQAIRDRGGDYLMVVKEDQPQLLEDIRMCFDEEPLPREEHGGPSENRGDDHGDGLRDHQSPGRAREPSLLEAMRGHWTIENEVHWVRDVTLGEDGCAVYKNRAHQVSWPRFAIY